VVLAVAMMIGAGQASAVEPKGMLKSEDVKALVANAKAAADHLKLARHYAAMAEKHEAEAKEHEALAAEYRRNPRASEIERPITPDKAGGGLGRGPVHAPSRQTHGERIQIAVPIPAARKAISSGPPSTQQLASLPSTTTAGTLRTPYA